MPLAERLRTLHAFATTRWAGQPLARSVLLRRQAVRLDDFLREVVPRAPFYRGYAARLDALPVVDKATTLAHFGGVNTVGVSLEQALDVALAAERSRDFAPTLPGGITVGLSSGTSGTRGVFLVSAAERARWAGVLLARLLSRSSLRQVLGVGATRDPLRIAFFLRANSNLYATLRSARVAFTFYDLLEPFDGHLPRLTLDAPDVVVAPPTVLRRLADAAQAGALTIAPRQVVSVAEVLETEDAAAVLAAWGVPVQQVYQATEGFLGVTCTQGRLHLNEDLLHVEPEWLDDGATPPTRFHPIVTDFTRTTQLVVRYRLDDVLRVDERPCPCGAGTLVLAAIEGRADDVLWATTPQGRAVAVFPDVVRRTLALVPGLSDYRVEQHGGEWRVRVRDAGVDVLPDIARECARLANQLGVAAPMVRREPWVEAPAGDKRRRIRCVRR